jgi:YesN/AraC family two-component response regulator
MRGLPRRAAEDFGLLAAANANRHVFRGVVRVCRASAVRGRPPRFYKPTRKQFSNIAHLLVQWGIGDDLRNIEEAWLQTRVVSRKQYESTLRLLEIFAQHLSMVANQLVIQCKQAEPASITRARQFILEHRGEELSLATVAKAVNISSYYFCKTFKKVTGLNFTDYLARARVEKAKELLLEPNARVSEIVFEVGFQSITHFNRIFKRHVGKSPTEYRKSLPKAAQPQAGFGPAQG